MGAFKLFISHSSRLDEHEDSDDPNKNPNLKLLQDVISGINDEYDDAVEILVDKDAQRLPAGCDWERRLNEWLAECHAAIILFSERALEKSNWVKKEAAILSWRQKLDKDFILIPVCIKDQTTPEDLNQSFFGTLGLGKVQSIRNAANSAEIVADIKSVLGPKETLASKCKRTPFEKLANVITELLIKNASTSTLEDACLKLPDTDKPHFHPDNKARYADALTRYMLRNGTDCLKHFQTVVNKIRPKVKEEHAKQILECIRSLWVDPKAAGCIPLAKNHKRFLAMNGKPLAEFTAFTCNRYSERAWPMDMSYKWVFTTQSDENLLIEEIREGVFRSKRKELTAEDCDSLINTHPRQVLVHSLNTEQNGGGLLDDPILRKKLRNKYPNVVFVLATGEVLPPNKPDDVNFVEPELDINLEKNSKITEYFIDDFLNDFYGY